MKFHAVNNQNRPHVCYDFCPLRLVLIKNFHWDYRWGTTRRRSNWTEQENYIHSQGDCSKTLHTFGHGRAEGTQIHTWGKATVSSTLKCWANTHRVHWYVSPHVLKRPGGGSHGAFLLCVGLKTICLMRITTECIFWRGRLRCYLSFCPHSPTY